ncbi:hypothetical protein KKC94_04805 [Patescibacteria group bacterium]|nr:hypothetical protein [Patescibacteria group bacterium]
MKIALLCGGPSLERGISLNSARSVADHLGGDGIEIVPIYFDHKKRAYHVSPSQLYSNTPSDFDFKLKKTAKYLSKTALSKILKTVDLAFPVMHGQFGEDGTIQRFLGRLQVPYVGSGVEACKRCFDKFEANEFIKSKGFYTLPSAVLKIHTNDHKEILEAFFEKHKVKRAVVKPATGGSSIGVFSVKSAEEALEKVRVLFSKRMDTRVVLEPFCDGTEFTVIILQNRFGMPVAVMPTEIETDYEGNQIFDYRKKYLPTRQVTYHCPPRFDNSTIEKIQVQAEQLFTVLGMRDFARFDGWLLPDGKIWFSDFNPISGMEQNSFLFQQAARVGLSHRDLLRFIVGNAAERNGLKFPEARANKKRQKKVNVLFGGSTSERQVSLMSGTNAWLKLRRSEKYSPKPFLLDMEENVWEVPYALTLNHTVEEVQANLENAEDDEMRLKWLEAKVKMRLALPDEAFTEKFFVPKKMSLEEFIAESRFVFIGLHGGVGENGTLQGMLKRAGVKFNGSGEKASEICMDKYVTGEKLKGMESEGIFVAPKKSIALYEFPADLEKFWQECISELGSKTLIVKPQDEGCSSGIVRLRSAKDLEKYLKLSRKGAPSIPMGTFEGQKSIIEMPLDPIARVILERFIEVDAICVKGDRLKWKKKDGWIEVTVGLLSDKDGGAIRALSPSLTVAEGSVLSVEEKFQGGTGINITPPSEDIVAPAVLKRVKVSIEKVADRLGLAGYARVDAFMNVDNGDIIVIEVNTAPALTPSTVLFHQALAEKPPIYPLSLLEKLIENKGY